MLRKNMRSLQVPFVALSTRLVWSQVTVRWRCRLCDSARREVCERSATVVLAVWRGWQG